MKKKDLRQFSHVLMALALVSVILAGLGATGTDLWLASTQWLLVSAVLTGFGLYTRIEK